MAFGALLSTSVSSVDGGGFFQETESEFLKKIFFCMNPGCAVGLCQALTADDHYFQTPPAEQFISLSSTRTALLLNNAR